MTRPQGRLLRASSIDDLPPIDKTVEERIQILEEQKEKLRQRKIYNIRVPYTKDGKIDRTSPEWFKLLEIKNGDVRKASIYVHNKKYENKKVKENPNYHHDVHVRQLKNDPLYNAKTYLRIKERVGVISRIRQLKNPEKNRESVRIYSLRHPDRIRLNSINFRQNNPHYSRDRSRKTTGLHFYRSYTDSSWDL